MRVIVGQSILNVFRGDTNNTIGCQLGDNFSQDVESNGAQWVQHTGFASIPPVAIPGVSAADSVVICDVNNTDLVIGSRHLSSQTMYGNLKPGEAAMYASGPDGNRQARVITKADGKIILYTTDTNDGTGAGVSLTIAPDSFAFLAPWGKLIFDKTGFHAVTPTGARLDLGGLNFPGLSQLGSYARVTAGTISLDGLCMLGTGLFKSAAYSTLDPPAPSTPILGVGTGSVVVAAAGSSSVFIGI